MGRKNKTVVRKKKTCGVDVPEAARKFAFGVVSDVEVPGVLLIGMINNVDVPVLVLKKNTMESKKKFFDADLLGVGIHDVELPAVVLKNKIYDVEVPDLGMRINISSTAKKRKFTDKEHKEKNNL